MKLIEALSFPLHLVGDEAAFRFSTIAPQKAQRRLLLRILDRNKATEYGRRNAFGLIRGISDYQHRVPIVDYDVIRPFVERMKLGEEDVLTSESPRIFATTSGTTGNSKFIPFTPTFIREYFRGSNVWANHLFLNHPRALFGQILHLVGPSVDGVTESGVSVGSISGFFPEVIPSYARRILCIPNWVSNIGDLDLKYYLIARLSLEKQITGIITPNPGALLYLVEQIGHSLPKLIEDIRRGVLRYPSRAALHQLSHDKRKMVRQLEASVKPNAKRACELESMLSGECKVLPKQYWPHLQFLSSFKCSYAKLFLPQYKRLFGDIPTRDPGYVSTEFRGSMCLSDKGAEGPLAVTSHFFEFCEEMPQVGSRLRLTLCPDLEVGREYYPVVTSSNGLYRYAMPDIVRVTGYYNATPMIEFVARHDSALSLVGEKLSEEQLLNAVIQCERIAQVHVRSILATYESVEEPRHAFLVEFERSFTSEQALAFLRNLDVALSRVNTSYRRKRALNSLREPKLKVVASEGFTRFRETELRRAARANQVKHVILEADPQVVSQFRVIETMNLSS